MAVEGVSPVDQKRGAGRGCHPPATLRRDGVTDQAVAIFSARLRDLAARARYRT